MSFEKEMITVGRRKGCEVVMKDKTISKFHANLKIKQNEVELYDLNSKSGVFVKFVSSKMPLFNEKPLSLAVGPVLLELEATRGWFFSAMNCCFDLSSPPFFVAKDYSCYNNFLKKEPEDAIELNPIGEQTSALVAMLAFKEKSLLENNSNDNRMQSNTFLGMMESLERPNYEEHSRIIEIPEEEDA